MKMNLNTAKRLCKRHELRGIILLGVGHTYIEIIAHGTDKESDEAMEGFGRTLASIFAAASGVKVMEISAPNIKKDKP